MRGTAAQCRGGMNHFVLGIIKIVLLEAFVGLLLIDRIAGTAFTTARKAAFAVISLAMLVAWASYGEQADNASFAYGSSAVILIVVSAWLVLAARPASAASPERALEIGRASCRERV